MHKTNFNNAKYIFYITFVTTVTYFYKVYGNTITKIAVNIYVKIDYIFLFTSTFNTLIFIFTYFCVDAS